MAGGAWRAWPLLAALAWACGPSDGTDGTNPAPCEPRQCGEAFQCGSIKTGCDDAVIDCGRCGDQEQCVIEADRSYCAAGTAEE